MKGSKAYHLGFLSQDLFFLCSPYLPKLYVAKIESEKPAPHPFLSNTFFSFRASPNFEFAAAHKDNRIFINILIGS